jgi:glutaredoxin
MNSDERKVLIKFYCAPNCPDCRRSSRVFDQMGILKEKIDISQVSEAAQQVERLTGGFQSVPAIIFPDGSFLVEPSDQILRQALEPFKIK